MGGFGGGMMMGGNMFGGSFVSGDFSIIGYSSEAAMTEFQNSVASIVDGTVFTEGTNTLECIITEELAAYNSLSVGDTITLVNPANEEETYAFTITGIYASSAANNITGNIFSTSQDPANQIYVSATALQTILDSSEVSSETVTDETTGRTYDTAISGSLDATYVFAPTKITHNFRTMCTPWAWTKATPYLPVMPHPMKAA